MSVLSLQNISFSYGKTPVLKDISYEFEKGKMYCIIGKSGAGKTTLLSLLSGLAAPNAGEIIYEPSPEEVLKTIVPEYLGGVLYGTLCESRASEQAARRPAMDAATQNAEDMIADLSLKFNQARQAAITQEITEIVAGS